MKKTFNRYYRSELNKLREYGDEFAKKNPGLAPFLEKDQQYLDPDVERLLEGFAFLTGRLRQKLDDELPELTQSLFALLWPNYLRPIPSTSILQFSPENNLHGKQSIAKGISVASEPINNKDIKGVICYFKTCYPVEVYPLAITDLDYQAGAGFEKSELTLSFELNQELSLDNRDLLMPSVRLFLQGAETKTTKLYLWLCHFIEKIEVQPLTTNSFEPFFLSKNAIRPVGFAKDEDVFPYPETVFSGYRILQEYFAIPEKFLFLDVNGLERLNFVSDTGFKLCFYLDTAFSAVLQPQIDNFQLFCTPIINLFQHDSEPIRVTQQQAEYLVNLKGSHQHYEIFDIIEVSGRQQETAKEQFFSRFESFEHSISFEAFEHRRTQKNQRAYYKVHLEPNISTLQFGGYSQLEGMKTSLSFVNARDKDISINEVFAVETVSVELMCTNGGLAESVGIGKINQSPRKIYVPIEELPPNTVSFKNITVVKAFIPPPIDTGLHWHLISSLGVNYKALTDIDALKFILSSYDFAGYLDETKSSRQRIESIKSINTQAIDRLERRRMLRINQINMVISETGFGQSDCEGQVYLFANILNEFFSLYAGINASHEFNVKVDKIERTYQWTRIKQNYRSNK